MSAPRSIWPSLAAVLVVGGALGAVWTARHPSGPTPSAAVDSAQPAALTYYYADSQGMYLVPEQGEAIAAAAPENWAEQAFARLRRPAGKKLVAAVGPETRLRAARYQAPRWTLEVETPRSTGSTGERMLVGALVRTFVGGWPGAREMQLKLVDGQGRPLPSQHLDLSAPLTLADVANTVDVAGQPGLRSTLWWPTKEGGALVPVQLALAGGSGVPPRDALERLLAGPPAEAGAFLTSVVPSGLNASWQSLEAGVVRVELRGSLPADERGRRFIEAAVLTLTEFPDVRAVQFVQAGVPLERRVGPYRLSDPIRRPGGVNAASASVTRHP